MDMTKLFRIWSGLVRNSKPKLHDGLLSSSNAPSETALVAASVDGHENVVNILLNAGADPNACKASPFIRRKEEYSKACEDDGHSTTSKQVMYYIGKAAERHSFLYEELVHRASVILKLVFSDQKPGVVHQTLL